MSEPKHSASNAKLGGFNLQAEQAIEFYKKSKKLTNEANMPSLSDLAGFSLLAFLINNEQSYHEALEIRKDISENHEKRQSIKDERISRLRKIQDYLRQRFIEVNDFIKKSEIKEMIAQKKIRTEERLHEKLEAEIESLTKDLETLEKFHEELEKTVKDFEPYEAVTNEVVTSSDIFSSIEDCMDRCDALMLSQDEINTLQKETQSQVKELRNKFNQEMTKVSSKIIGLNNELTESEQDYVNAQAESFKWEKVLKKTKDFFNKKELNECRILDAIQQIYGLLRKRNGFNAHGDRMAYEKLLDYTKHETDILREVLDMCEKGPYKSKFTHLRNYKKSEQSKLKN